MIQSGVEVCRTMVRGVCNKSKAFLRSCDFEWWISAEDSAAEGKPGILGNSRVTKFIELIRGDEFFEISWSLRRFFGVEMKDTE